MGKKKMNFVNSEPVKVDREIFLQSLMKNLIVAKNKFPDVYTWPESDVLEVFRRFVESLENGTYSRHVHAIKWTIKELKMKDDRETINLIFNETKGK